ncbi:MAG: (Fe-S)-binding protein [Bacteroidia bacterium]|nr:(Fe-S)-binding protein [Bacteroidia bacterium]
MTILLQLVFAVALGIAGYLFYQSINKIRRNILLGKDIQLNDNPEERRKIMLRVALGQSKMITRPIAGILHIFIYVGFLIVNLEMVEILIDGLLGTHRILSFLGTGYSFLTGVIEIMMLLVVVASVAFLVRRNIIKLPRFTSPELKGFPMTDANIILFTEITLMLALFLMNAADQVLQSKGTPHYVQAGYFPISQWLAGSLSGLDESTLIILERSSWWIHILGILAFLNYIPRSKHLHIFLTFPNTYYSRLSPKGKMTNMESITQEVKLMLAPSLPAPEAPSEPQRFGAKDVFDLTWKHLLDAYTCTECGRCTSVCPANITGKALSPRKIMMDTRDRLEEVGRNIDANGGKFVDDGKSLYMDYIKPEEIWACTTCNACVEACPANIEPLAIILELRRYAVMEESKQPETLSAMFNNIENAYSPWAFSPSDRFNWANDIQMPEGK